MDSRTLYLGVDGGGSKTTAVVFTDTGSFVAGIVGESINYYSIGMDTARKNMRLIVEALRKDLGGASFKTAVIGMSALNSRANETETAAFAQGIIDAEKIIMDSDLYIAMKALRADGECAVVVAGTGSMVIARNENGETKFAGGWGHILGDEGSGYRIGLDGIKAAIRAGEGGEKTALLAQCLDFFGIKSIYELIELYYGEGVVRKKTAAFAVNVRICAERNDRVAANIIREQSLELFKTAMYCIPSLGKDAPIGLWGGVFQHSEMFANDFTSLLSDAGYKNVKLLPFTPEVGAILTCFEENSVAIDEDTARLLKESYDFYACKVI